MVAACRALGCWMSLRSRHTEILATQAPDVYAHLRHPGLPENEIRSQFVAAGVRPSDEVIRLVVFLGMCAQDRTEILGVQPRRSSPAYNIPGPPWDNRWTGRTCRRGGPSSWHSIKFAAVVRRVGRVQAIDNTRARSSCRGSPRVRGRRHSFGGSCCDRHCSDRARPGPGCQATDLSVAQAVEAECEDLADDGALGDRLAAAFSDALCRPRPAARRRSRRGVGRLA
jgi:hypothetical protein